VVATQHPQQFLVVLVLQGSVPQMVAVCNMIGACCYIRLLSSYAICTLGTFDGFVQRFFLQKKKPQWERRNVSIPKGAYRLGIARSDLYCKEPPVSSTMRKTAGNSGRKTMRQAPSPS